MGSLADLLEQQSGRRMASLDRGTGIDVQAPPSAPPPIELGGDYLASGTNLQSLLPILLNTQRQNSMGGPVGGSNNWEQVARRIATNKYGYSPSDFNKLDSIIERESGWDPNAVNQSSGAYGIPQILPSAHPDANLQGDPRGQIRWLLNYIEGRYGNINNALAFKDREGWY